MNRRSEELDRYRAAFEMAAEIERQARIKQKDAKRDQDAVIDSLIDKLTQKRGNI